MIHMLLYLKEVTTMKDNIKEYVLTHEDYSKLGKATVKELFKGISYFESFYMLHDEVHNIYHVIDVTMRALCMNKKLNLNIPRDQIIIAGLAHDMFSVVNREQHHVGAYNWVMRHRRSKRLFGYYKFRRIDYSTIAHAVLEHRASYRGKYTSLLSELISAADRDKPDLMVLIERVYKCAKDPSNIFEIDKGKKIPDIELAHGNLRDIAKRVQGMYSIPIYKAYVHLIEKYHANGYARRNAIYDAYYGKEQDAFYKELHELTAQRLVEYILILERIEHEKQLYDSSNHAELKMLCGWERS